MFFIPSLFASLFFSFLFFSSQSVILSPHYPPHQKQHGRFLTPLLLECLMEFCKASLTFESADEILWCDHSNETSLPVLTRGAIYIVCFPNFWVCGRNPMIWPFKWKLSACSFIWCYLFVKILENEIWKSGRNLPLATFGSERVKISISQR